MAVFLFAPLVLGGCGGPAPPAGAMLTLDAQAAPPTLPGLAITSGALHLEPLVVVGDNAPDGRTTLHEASIPLDAAGASFTFPDAPQDLYSRVHLVVDELELQGTFQGTPLHVHLDSADVPVDVRAAAGKELSPGNDVAFALGFGPAPWLTADELTSATANGEIVVDASNHPELLDPLAQRLAASFTLQ